MAERTIDIKINAEQLGTAKKRMDALAKAAGELKGEIEYLNGAIEKLGVVSGTVKGKIMDLALEAYDARKAVKRRKTGEPAPPSTGGGDVGGGGTGAKGTIAGGSVPAETIKILDEAILENKVSDSLLVKRVADGVAELNKQRSTSEKAAVSAVTKAITTTPAPSLPQVPQSTGRVAAPYEHRLNVWKIEQKSQREKERKLLSDYQRKHYEVQQKREKDAETARNILGIMEDQPGRSSAGYTAVRGKPFRRALYRRKKEIIDLDALIPSEPEEAEEEILERNVQDNIKLMEAVREERAKRFKGKLKGRLWPKWYMRRVGGVREDTINAFKPALRSNRYKYPTVAPVTTKPTGKFVDPFTQASQVITAQKAPLISTQRAFEEGAVVGTRDWVKQPEIDAETELELREKQQISADVIIEETAARKRSAQKAGETGQYTEVERPPTASGTTTVAGKADKPVKRRKRRSPTEIIQINAKVLQKKAKEVIDIADHEIYTVSPTEGVGGWVGTRRWNVDPEQVMQFNRAVNKLHPKLRELAKKRDLFMFAANRYSSAPGQVGIVEGESVDTLASQHEFIHSEELDKLISSRFLDVAGTPRKALKILAENYLTQKTSLQDLFKAASQSYASGDKGKEEKIIRDISTVFISTYDDRRDKWAANIRDIIKDVVPESKLPMPTDEQLEPLMRMTERSLGFREDQGLLFYPQKSKAVGINIEQLRSKAEARDIIDSGFESSLYNIPHKDDQSKYGHKLAIEAIKDTIQLPYKTLVAKKGEEIVGAISYMVDKATGDFLIGSFGVLDPGRGIGKMLLKRVEGIADEFKANTIRIPIATIDAQEIYEHLGYEYEGSNRGKKAPLKQAAEMIKSRLLYYFGKGSNKEETPNPPAAPKASKKGKGKGKSKKEVVNVGEVVANIKAESAGVEVYDKPPEPSDVIVVESTKKPIIVTGTSADVDATKVAEISKATEPPTPPPEEKKPLEWLYRDASTEKPSEPSIHTYQIPLIRTLEKRVEDSHTSILEGVRAALQSKLEKLPETIESGVLWKVRSKYFPVAESDVAFRTKEFDVSGYQLAGETDTALWESLIENTLQEVLESPEFSTIIEKMPPAEGKPVRTAYMKGSGINQITKKPHTYIASDMEALMRETIREHFDIPESAKPSGSVIDANELIRREIIRGRDERIAKIPEMPTGAMKPPTDKKGIWGSLKEAVTGGEDIGKVMDKLATKGGSLGRLGWVFTSLAMSSLGVYFSLIGVVTMLQKGIGTVLGPLNNLQGIIEGFAYNQKEFAGTSLDLDKVMKQLGIDFGDVADATFYLKAVMGTVQGMFAAFGTMVLLDPGVQGSIQSVIKSLKDFLFVEEKIDPSKPLIGDNIKLALNPELLALVRDIFRGMADAMPAVLSSLMLLGNLIKDLILPHATLFATAWAAAIVLMPIFSFLSAMANIVKALVAVSAAAISAGASIKSALAPSPFAAYGQAAGVVWAGAFIAGVAAGITILGIMDLFDVEKWIHKKAWDFKYDTPYPGEKERPGIIKSFFGYPEYNTGEDAKQYIEAHKEVTKRASGGPLKKGQVALVGERGPEIIIPKGDVDVVPNKDLRKLADGTLSSYTESRDLNDISDATQETANILKDIRDNTSFGPDTPAGQYMASLASKGTAIKAAGDTAMYGGPTAATLKGAGPYTMAAGRNKWFMDTSASMGEGWIDKPKTPETPDIETPEISPLLKILGGIGSISGFATLAEIASGGKLSAGMGSLGRGIATRAGGWFAGGGAGLGAEEAAALAPGAAGHAGTGAAMGEGAVTTASPWAARLGTIGAGVSRANPYVQAMLLAKGIGIGTEVGGPTDKDFLGIPELKGLDISTQTPMAASVVQKTKDKTGWDKLNEGTIKTNELISAANRQSKDDAYKSLSIEQSQNSGIWTIAKTIGGAAGGGTGGSSPTQASGSTTTADWINSTRDRTNAFLREGGWTRGPGGLAETGREQTDEIFNSFKQSIVSQNRRNKVKGGLPEGVSLPFVEQANIAGDQFAYRPDTSRAMMPGASGSEIFDVSEVSMVQMRKAQEEAKASQERAAKLKAMSPEEYRKLMGYESLQEGGRIGKTGMIMAHAGEVVAPAAKITDMASPSITIGDINITINGNASKEVTDDMIRQIKRELFGRGITV